MEREREDREGERKGETSAKVCLNILQNRQEEKKVHAKA